MKITLFTTVTLFTTALTILNLNAFAQGVGSVNFANGPANRVFQGDGTPVPRAVDGGSYLAELLSALDGAHFATATRQGLTTTFHGPVAGVFNGGGRTVPTTQNGGFGQFQVRVWDTRAGATYEQARTSVDSRYCVGESPVFRIDTADASAVPPPPPAPLNMPSFIMINLGGPPCPEPSTYALALLGAGALWLLRRKR